MKMIFRLLAELWLLLTGLFSSNMINGRLRPRPSLLLFAAALCISAIAQAQLMARGAVTNQEGMPVANATVSTADGKRSAVTDSRGVFNISLATLPDTLVVQHVNYVTKRFAVNQVQTALQLVLSEATNELDETVVIGYGSTTRRMNTGAVASISAKEIARQPVSNPLTALTGRMAGVVVTQQSGVPGAMVRMQVRGRNSITQGTDPLFIIDGVPFAAGNQPINRNGSLLTAETGTGLSPFATLAPADIERIEVLKDADATAIYGSRGANGVVLITTKRGQQGKTRVQANVYTSISSPTRTIPMMNTGQYLQMRREAFANDNLVPTNINAPDLLLWDTTRHTDFTRLLYGGNGATVNSELTLSGGDANTQYLIGGSYRNEQTIFTGDMNTWRATGNMSLQHNTAGDKLQLMASVLYSHNESNLTPADAGLFISSVPNLPALYDSTGKLNWQQGGVNFLNPMHYQHQRYHVQTATLNSRFNLDYKMLPFLRLRAALGYNALRNDEESVFSLASQNPHLNPIGSLELGDNRMQSWIFEPQAEARMNVFGGKLTALVGATLQHNHNTGLNIKSSGYSSDNLIRSLAAGPVTEYKLNSESRYRYQAVFGRLNYVLANRYLLNISGRRDGSSRFGPGNRYSNFGAVGAGWIFSEESFIARRLRFLSYGKLRGSFGSSGNDQIGDYAYLDGWGATLPYQGATALNPLNLFNPDYRWEINRKLEAALELGFFKDRVLLNVAWFRNRSGNQLINFRLPSQTGFNGVIRNLDAVVENTGLEVELTTRNITTRHFEWTTGFNITLPRNRLMRFPGLATSAYANSYVIGEPLSVIYRFRYLGVDSATGVFRFDDVNRDGLLNVADYQVGGFTDPRFFGGLQNTFRYKAVELSFFAEFRKQTGRNYLHSLYSARYVPGMMQNMPLLALNRWQQPGDHAVMQRYTASTTSLAHRATTTFLLSDGVFSDASFIRLRNVSLSYALPGTWLRKLRLQQGSFYINAQNLLTITAYEGSDPETQNLWQAPPLRTFAAGINITL